MIPSTIKYAAQGAARYVTGDVTRYDQKNEMFKRPFWDPQKEKLRDQFYYSETPPRDKPGYRLTDQALVKGVSRRHAKISRKGPQIYLEDLGSVNGTLLNGKRLTPYLPHVLRDKDEIRIGKLLMRIHLSA